MDGQRALLLLNKLPEMYKEAVFMRFVNGLELSEIAVAEQASVSHSFGGVVFPSQMLAKRMSSAPPQ